jgi:hypothetical protein
MKIPVLMHTESEGPRTLGYYLFAENLTPRICRLFDADPLPHDPLEFDGIVSMGGPTNI